MRAWARGKFQIYIMLPAVIYFLQSDQSTGMRQSISKTIRLRVSGAQKRTPTRKRWKTSTTIWSSGRMLAKSQRKSVISLNPRKNIIALKHQLVSHGSFSQKKLDNRLQIMLEDGRSVIKRALLRANTKFSFRRSSLIHLTAVVSANTKCTLSAPRFICCSG